MNIISYVCKCHEIICLFYKMNSVLVYYISYIKNYEFKNKIGIDKKYWNIHNGITA